MSVTFLTNKDKDEILNNINEVSEEVGQLSEDVDALNQGGMKGYVTPQMFDARADGVTDDTAAIQAAIDSGRRVEINGEYLITAPLVLKSDTHISGIGKITKTNATTDAEGINAVFVVRGEHISVDGLTIYGDGTISTGTTNSVVNGIVIASGTRHISFSKIKIWRCLNAVLSVAPFFMATFDRVHCCACGSGFNFTDKSNKTTILLQRCYAANCGTAYQMYGVTYSTLIDCAADMCNFRDTTNPWGDGGHGAKNSDIGVYSFFVCNNVTLQNCGTESSYGNGAVYLHASMVDVDGMTVIDLKSQYEPDYTNYPYDAVGVIQTSHELSRVSINNLNVTDFTNTYVADNYPQKKQCVVACNYNAGASGLIKDRVISIKHRQTPTVLPIFAGTGANNQMCHDETINDLVTGYSTKFVARELKVASEGTVVTVPFLSDPNYYRNHILTVWGVNCKNGTDPMNTFKITLAIQSCSAIQNVEILDKSSDSITVSKSGLDVKITLPYAYSRLCLAGEAYGKHINLIDWYNVALN